MRRRILYVGDLFGTCAQRMETLAELGCEMIPFSALPYTRDSNWFFQKLGHHGLIGPAIAGFNSDLVGFARSAKPEWIWVDRGLWVFPRTLDRLRSAGATRLVHYTPDAAFVVNASRHFNRCVSRYDGVVTTKHYELDRYAHHGARHVLFQYQGYDERIFRPIELDAEDRQRFAADVMLVARYEPHYERTVLAAAETGAQVAVWGPFWPEAAGRNPALKPLVRGGALAPRDYSKAISGARICLGVLCKLNQDQSTTRSFEIPGAGGFFLAERTTEHEHLYREGVEAEFYADFDEMRAKIRHYLSDDAARCAIAGAGRARCVADGHTYRDRMRQILDAAEGWSSRPAA